MEGSGVYGVDFAQLVADLHSGSDRLLCYGGV